MHRVPFHEIQMEHVSNGFDTKRFNVIIILFVVVQFMSVESTKTITYIVFFLLFLG